jgi:hypothetical protein
LDKRLRERLAKLEALFARAGTAGEQAAAGYRPDSFALSLMRWRLGRLRFCAARSGAMFMYLRVDHWVPAMCRSLAAARLRQD